MLGLLQLQPAGDWWLVHCAASRQAYCTAKKAHNATDIYHSQIDKLSPASRSTLSINLSLPLLASLSASGCSLTSLPSVNTRKAQHAHFREIRMMIAERDTQRPSANYQLLSGLASIELYLRDKITRPAATGNGARAANHRLFTRFRARAPQARRMWKGMGVETPQGSLSQVVMDGLGFLTGYQGRVYGHGGKAPGRGGGGGQRE